MSSWSVVPLSASGDEAVVEDKDPLPVLAPTRKANTSGRGTGMDARLPIGGNATRAARLSRAVDASVQLSECRPASRMRITITTAVPLRSESHRCLVSGAADTGATSRTCALDVAASRAHVEARKTDHLPMQRVARGPGLPTLVPALVPGDRNVAEALAGRSSALR